MSKAKAEKMIREAESLSPPYTKEQIRLIQKSFGISQAEFAKYFLGGVPIDTYRNWTVDSRPTEPPEVFQTAIYLLVLLRKTSPRTLLDYLDGSVTRQKLIN